MLSGHLFPRSQLLIYCHLVENRSSKEPRLPATGALSGETLPLYSRARTPGTERRFGDTF